MFKSLRLDANISIKNNELQYKNIEKANVKISKLNVFM